MSKFTHAVVLRPTPSVRDEVPERDIMLSYEHNRADAEFTYGIYADGVQDHGYIATEVGRLSFFGATRVGKHAMRLRDGDDRIWYLKIIAVWDDGAVLEPDPEQGVWGGPSYTSRVEGN